MVVARGAAPGDDKNYSTKTVLLYKSVSKNDNPLNDYKLKELADKEPMVPDGTTCCVGGRVIDIQVVHILVLFL